MFKFLKNRTARAQNSETTQLKDVRRHLAWTKQKIKIRTETFMNKSIRSNGTNTILMSC